MHAQSTAGRPAAAQGPVSPEPGRYPRTFSYRPRRSTLSPGQQRTWERLWPEYGLDSPQPGGAEPPRPVDTVGWFGRDAPLVLEIGSGTGTATAAMARAEPGIDVVAVETYRRGLAQLLTMIDREGIENIRLIRGEAVEVLDRLIAPESLTGVRVFFPDPWPKARHHKRRLLQPATLALIATRLRPGGVLHVATDHPGYAEQIGAAGDGEPRLRRVTGAQRLPISVSRPATKYATKAADAGSPVTELLWERR